MVGNSSGGRKNAPEKDVDQVNSSRTDLATTITRLLAQAQTMFLDFQKFAINRKDVGRPARIGGRELALGVCQDFFEMLRHRGQCNRGESLPPALA
jgi:hypothetical protein